MKSIDRRKFLSILAAGGATVSLECNSSAKVNKLIPYVIPPENIRPGVWTHFATTCRECPAGCGMHVRVRDGRVVKVEGNPIHPVSRGGLCPRGQSAPQGLYDPDRIKGPLRRGKNGNLIELSWDDALNAIAQKIGSSDSSVAVISDLQTGSMQETITLFLSNLNSERHLIYEPFNYDPLKKAHQLLFGINGIPRYKLNECDFIISFGADFLETWVSPVEFAWHFGEFHSANKKKMNTFVYVGPRLSMTAANADQYIATYPGDERWVALAMVQAMVNDDLVKNNKNEIMEILSRSGADQITKNLKIPMEQIRSLAHSFALATNSVALASPVAARNSKVSFDSAMAAALLNFTAGRIGTSVDFSYIHALSRVDPENHTDEFLKSITGKDIVIIINTNIVFTYPAAVEHLRRAREAVYLSTLPDETSQIASYILPIDSPLESWGDYEPYTGIQSIMQPAMARVFDTRPAGDILLSIGRKSIKNNTTIPESFQDVFYKRWARIQNLTIEGSQLWTTVLRTGGFEEKSKITSRTITTTGVNRFEQTNNKRADKVAIWLWPSIMLYDGRLANRGWMQEAPEPVSYAVWSSWVDIHPETAKSLNISGHSIIKVDTVAGHINAPVRITEQVVAGCIAIMLGQGHTAPGLNQASRVGVNPFVIVNNTDGLSFGTASLYLTGESGAPVYTSPTYNQYNRDILKTVSFSEFKDNTLKIEEIIYPLAAGYARSTDLYSSHTHRKHRWAMVVDLQRCIGCGACAIACYAENNISVMGKVPVEHGREMAWLKIVPYNIPGTQSIAWLPMLCQHCDAAPCEPVCPVYASVHNEEGLNAQIYNRCIGTRYCSNNCPYKVRRFNWFNTTWKKPLDVQLNPEVSVRCRGVMEKCTFCVQRIREVEFRAMQEHRAVRDGEIQPACVQSCPTKVYTFGDLNDKNSQVSKMFACDERRYQVLKELNTKPAIVYLKKIWR